ncbi:unnamed protein product [Parnassius apollo]|uniref:(apollo) hypothetical protein n=1 Tax=Parnassius apollo TaxID=110799 RepID=A0A8S3XT15_PARAO|nr:unnamed protein product [Parnassius apollo]
MKLFQGYIVRVFCCSKCREDYQLQDLRRILEESDYELSNDDTDSNGGGDSDVQDKPDSDISDQEPSIFFILQMTISMIRILNQREDTFRQYNPSKARKYGLKIYKLCTEDGFVWNYDIYIGRDPEIADLDKPGSVIVQLCDGLLEAGRIIVCDNYYNTVRLAKYLLQHKTDLCDTLRVNRKELPWAIRLKKIRPKKGEVVARQKDNVTVMKWRDKRCNDFYIP